MAMFRRRCALTSGSGRKATFRQQLIRSCILLARYGFVQFPLFLLLVKMCGFIVSTRVGAASDSPQLGSDEFRSAAVAYARFLPFVHFDPSYPKTGHVTWILRSIAKN